MKLKKSHVSFLLAAASCASSLQAADGIWTQSTSGGLWTNTANWNASTIADGAGFTADFSTLNPTTDAIVDLTGAGTAGVVTLGTLKFADTTAEGGAPTFKNWILGNPTGANLSTVAIKLDNSPNPGVIDVASGSYAKMALEFNSGTNGYNKTGGGELWLGAGTAGGQSKISGSGLIDVQAGTLTINASGGSTTFNGTYQVASGALLQIGRADNFGTLTGNVTLNGGTIYFNRPGAQTAMSLNNAIGGTSGLLKFNNAGGTTTQSATAIISGGVSVEVVANPVTLSQANTYTGTSTVTAGTLQFAKTVAFYSNVVDSTNAAKLTVNSGGTGAFNVGGTGEFAEADINTLLGASNGTVGFKTGAILGLDTGGGSFTYATNLANPTGSTSLGLTKLGNNTLTLTGTNTYTGSTTISIGTLQAGANSAFGSGSLVINGGTVASNAAVGAGDRTLGNAVTIGGNITLGNGTNTGVLNFTNTVGLGGTTRTLTANSATNLSGVVSGTAGLIKAGSGTLALLGANTYSGKTSISNGTLSISSIKNVSGGANALGSVTTVANGTLDIGSGSTSATLQYTGTGDTTNRVINLSGLTGGATLDQSGTAALTFSSGLSTLNVGNKTLTLTGSTAGTGTFSGAIVDGSSVNASSVNTSATTAAGGTTITLTSAAGLKVGQSVFGTGIATNTIITAISGNVVTLSAGAATGGVPSGTSITFAAGTAVTAVSKNGTGTWTLPNANTYTGQTSISDGTLAAGNDGAFGSGKVNMTGGTVASADATNRVFANNFGIGGSLNVTLGTATTGNLKFTGTCDLGGTNKSITVANAITEFSGGITNSTGGPVNKLGSGTLLFSGTGGGKSFTLSAGTLAVTSTGQAVINSIGMNGGTLQWSGVNTQDLSSKVIMLTGMTAIFDTNGNDVTFGSGIGSTTTAALNKIGTGTLSLNGTLSYTGATTVTGGTLSLGTATLDDASTISIASGATLNLSHGTTDSIGSLVINGVPQLNGLYKSSTGVGPGTVLASLTGTGKLQVTAGVSITYAGWVSSKGLTVGVNDAKSDNPDNDGLNNLGEFAFDGSPLSGKSDGKIVSKIAVIGGEDVLTLTLPVLSDATFSGFPALASNTVLGMTYHIECSDGLTTFDMVVEEVTDPTDLTSIQGTLAVDHPLTAGWSYRTFRVAPVSAASKQFLRARVTE